MKSTEQRKQNNRRREDNPLFLFSYCLDVTRLNVDVDEK